MNINKLISYVSMILIVMLFVGVVSATEADSGDILETNNENTIVEQSSVIDTSGSQETDDVSEVLSAGDSEVLGAGEGTYTELHELIQGNATININKDYKYDPDVDKKYSWNGYEDAQDYKYGIPIWDVKAGFNNVKTITINGNGHTIDGNHMARIFNASHLGQLTVSGVNLVINNLTFINGCVESADTSTSRGGAIVVGPYKVTLTLNNCTFEDNMAKNTNMGDPVGNESNYGTAWGGAVYINGISGTDYSTLNVNNCTFRNNTANYGGAIASSSTHSVGKVYIKDSLFDDNHADSHPYNYSNGQYYFNGKWYSHGWGGAVYSYYTEVLNSTFVNNRGGNRSGFGGAISTYNGKFEDSKFINNTCYQGGAIADGHLTHGTSAVDTDSSKYEIDNCTFDNNKAQLSGGAVLTRNLGAYFFAYYGDMVVNNSNFTNNYGGIYGGGAIMSSCPFIYNSNFINNSAYNYGGAVTAGYAELGNVTFTNNSAAHSGALFCIEPYFIENTEVTFNDNYIIPRVLYDNGFTTNDTEVQDGKVIVTSDLSFYVSGNRLWNLDPAWTKWIELNGTEYLPLMYIYKDSPAMNKGVGYYGFDYEVDLYGHAIEYDHKDVKGGYGQVSPGGAEGIVTDDLSYLINYIDGRELKEYIKILYYLCNLNESFMDGAFRNKEAGELALEFPIKELCFSDLSNPINDLMKNITDLYDSGFRVPNNYYKLSDTLKDHMAHSNVMVPDNADDILKDDKTVIIYHPFLYIVPFYHTHYLSYYQTNITIEKITLNKTVMLGEDVEFKVTVTNGGNYSVYDIFVQDYQYDTDGLIYKGYKNDTGKWVYDEQTRKYNLVDVEHYVSVNPLNNQVVEEDVVGALKPRTSKSIIFVFTTNKTGVFNNTATNGYSNATNNTTVIAPDLKIEKITLNKTVYLGNQTMFKLRVTNTGAFDLSNIIVEEYEYDDGLVLVDFKADWPWFGNINTKKFVYLDTLKPGESSEFIVIFNTTKIGNFTNYAVATHNKTGNRTANNTTEVIFMINITKIWDDADNQDGIRPKNVTVELLADGEKVDEIVLSENNNWAAYFKELHGYNEEGNLINYTVKELKVDNYTTINLGNITALNITINDNSFEIKNNHTPLLTNVTVNKKWDDRDNQDGIRPHSIVVNLLADGHVIDQATLSLTAGSNWTYTFVNLPVNKKGKKINYTVEEVDVDGYEALITNSTLYNWTVTNVHVPELVNVTVQKVWSDADNQDGFRPVSVEVQLLANGTVINSTVLDASNGWKFTFKDLDKYYNGTVIVYSVNETAVVNYSVNITSDGNGNWTVNNTHVPELINVTVVKIWIDNDDYDKVRPTSISIQLYANGIKVNETTLSGDKWEHTFKNLPKYDAGELIKYSVNETKVTDYNTTIENFTITNIHVRPNMTVEKITLNKTVLVGEKTSFTIKVTNTGNCDLSDISVVEDVPEGLRYDGKFTGKNWFNNGNKFIYIGKLTPGESTSFNITFTAIEVGDWLNKVNATSNETENKTTNNTTTVLNPGMAVRKISLNESVYLGKQVGFTIVVYNTGSSNLTGIYVVDDDYTEGIVLDHMIPNDDWTFDGKNRFTYGKTIGVGESANFTVIFNTTSIGNKINNVTAGSNETNETNSSNKTFVYVANMTVRKISLNESVYLGTPVAFTVVVTNNGNIDLTGVYVVDNDFTEGIVLDHMEPNDDWIFDGKDRFTYVPDVLHVGESANFTIWFNTTSVGNKINNVTADSNETPEVNSTNKTYVYVGNMSVRKISLNESVYLGNQVGFIVVVTNTGDCDLTGVYVVDNDFTEGIVLDHMVPNADWTFDGKDRFTYVPDVLHVGESANFTIWFNTTSVGNKTNNVTADSNETPEVNSTNKTYVYVGNMSVRKISLNESVYLGNQVGFIVVVTNIGDCDLTGVYVVDNDFTEGIVLDHMVPNADWTFDGKDRFDYVPDVLHVGESANFTIWFNTTSIGDKINNVTADSNETPEVNSTNKTHVYVGNMSVRKISLNESVMLGNQVGFIVVVSNTGDCDLPGVYVVDNDFTEGIVLDHMDPNGDWTFNGKDKFTYNHDVLPVGESANFTIWFNTTSTGFKVNNVTAGNNLTPEVNSTNNTTVYKPDLGVRKISLHKSVYLGTPVAFIVVVTNIGDCDLTGVYVVDNDFTEGIVLDHMESNDDWIFDGKDRFTYVPDVLHVGESANFTIWFNTTSIGDKINNVTADSNETPEVNSSNKTHVYVGNMSVRKISLNESVYLGNQVGFIVVVTNTGDCDLPGVYVVDNDFSEGIVLDHMVPNADWTFDGNDRFTYNHDVLGVGESANFTIWFNTTSVGDKINNVTAGNDLTPDVNSSNKTHVYDGEMTVRKISNNESVKVGEQVSFTIVVKNTGGCDLTGVYVVDNDYSSGLVYDHFVDSSNKWNYEGNGKWTFTDVLGIGEEASFDVIFNATTVGVKFNNVTAGDNITNKTVNSTNKTNVTNETVPPEPEPPVPEPPVPVPPQPVPPSPEVPSVPPKEIPVKHATGNPILVLLLVLFTLSVNVSRRKKQ